MASAALAPTGQPVAVLEVVAEWLQVPVSSLSVLQGDTARDKVLAIATRDPGALCQRIETLLAVRVDKAKGGG